MDFIPNKGRWSIEFLFSLDFFRLQYIILHNENVDLPLKICKSLFNIFLGRTKMYGKETMW